MFAAHKKQRFIPGKPWIILIWNKIRQQSSAVYLMLYVSVFSARSLHLLEQALECRCIQQTQVHWHWHAWMTTGVVSPMWAVCWCWRSQCIVMPEAFSLSSVTWSLVRPSLQCSAPKCCGGYRWLQSQCSFWLLPGIVHILRIGHVSRILGLACVHWPSI